MKNLKQKLTLILLSVLIVVAVANLFNVTEALALSTPGNVQDAVSELPSELNEENRVTTVINWLLGIAATIAVLFIIISGIRYIISTGDQNEITGAKATLKYSIMGLIVVILAMVVVNVVIRIIS